MTANATDAPPACILSAGIAGALMQAGVFIGAVFLFRANLIWGGRGEIPVYLSSMGTGLIAVVIPVLLLKLKYSVSGGHTMMLAGLCLLGAPVLLVVAFTILGVATDGFAGFRAGVWAALYSVFMFVPGLPGVAAGAWVGSRRFRKRTEVGASG